MAIPFARSMRSLEADSFRFSGILLAIAAVLLAAWAGWFFLARVSLYELSDSARVEVAAASSPVAAPVAARIAAAHVTLGQQVAAGDLLFELEARTEALELQEERSTRAANQSELTQLREEMDSDYDGQFDWIDHYQKGWRVMSEYDTDGDGKPNVFKYYTRAEDGSMRVDRKERDEDGDGKIDVWERFSPTGDVIRTGRDTDGDGKVDIREE